jgi:hypothetical protein
MMVASTSVPVLTVTALDLSLAREYFEMAARTPLFGGTAE